MLQIYLTVLTFLLRKRRYLFVIAALTLVLISPQTSDNMLVDRINFNTSQNFTSEDTDISEWLWHNDTKCYSHSHDLPYSNNSFVGRHEEMMEVIQLMNAAHIIGINGAPGFGKSQLAIHVGYEMVSRGTNVRYIDAVDKLSYLNAFVRGTEPLKSDSSNKFKARKLKQNKAKHYTNMKSLSKKSSSLHTPLIQEYASDKVIDNLLKWSTMIDCRTVLILDNCDDIIHSEVPRERLIELIKAMIKNSNYHLHIIITSRQQILLVDDFESVVIKELSEAASVELLELLSPRIARSHAEQVAALVEGCPLALKVVGKLLHKQEDMLTKSLELDLLNQPMRVLDKASTQKERFSAIMDMVYKQFSISTQKCGYYLSLFNGSFEHQAGLTILPTSLNPQQCFESYVEHSLLDKYFFAQVTLYKMHRLIREYLKNKGGYSENYYYYHDFQENFCIYFTDYILSYSLLMKESNITEIDQYVYSSQPHNIHNFLNILLSRDKYRTKELVVLFFAVGENLISVNSIKPHFHSLISNVNETCVYVSAERCGKLFSFITKELYQGCRCTTVKNYFLQILKSSCMDVFNCVTVTEIRQNPSILAKLDQQERAFVLRLELCYCRATFFFNCLFYNNFIIPSLFPMLCFIALYVVMCLSNIRSMCDIRNILFIILFVSYLIMLFHVVYLTLMILMIYDYDKMTWMMVVFPSFSVQSIRFLLSIFVFVMALLNNGSFFGNHSMTTMNVISYMCAFEVYVFWRLFPYCF